LRRALVIAYHFPPIGGAGVQRSAKFVRYLPELGYSCTVVTGPGTGGTRWTPVDESLLRELPEGTEIVRVPGQAPVSGRARQRAERWLGVRKRFAAWWVAGVLDAARELPFDLAYASLSPWDSAAAAAKLAALRGVPWVADLRDPWALDEMAVYPSGIHRRLELRRMRLLLARADAVVMNTPEAARQAQALLGASAPRIVAIPNGFDSADFDGPQPERVDGAFRIVHTGYLHTALGRDLRATGRLKRLIGGAAPVDILTRSHVYLLDALDEVRARDPDGKDVELHLAGVLSDPDREAIGARAVRTLGFLPHDETVQLMRSADLLFLPMHDLPRGRRATVVPGKTYEYLAARRPILAAVPDGDARDLLERSGIARLCRPAASSCMAEAILEELRRRREGEAERPIDEEMLAAYERRRLAERLAREVFDAVLGPVGG
jgi:glycosyltransferase involved in cell wall biosynthesis